MQQSADDRGAALVSHYIAGLFLETILCQRPDAVLVVGDRSETLALCSLVVCLKLPIIHISGGEVTAGAIDDVCRNAISQLATWHFVGHEQAASKLRYMGITNNIHVVGEPAIDLILAGGRKRVPGLDIVLIYHPTTLGSMGPLEEIQEVIAGLTPAVPAGGKVIMCGANPDAGGLLINEYLQTLGDRFVFAPNMGPDQYWDLLSTCACLVGNSSSGICEAPALGVPVVNIGDRQLGRMRRGYVEDVPCEAEAITRAIRTAMADGVAQPDFAYGDGKAGERIARILLS